MGKSGAGVLIAFNLMAFGSIFAGFIILENNLHLH